jgi:hypothetical protein
LIARKLTANPTSYCFRYGYELRAGDWTIGTVWFPKQTIIPQRHVVSSEVFRMELDVAERKAVELIRSRLDAASITVLSAKMETDPSDQITVNGLFQDQKGNQRKFEVKFQVKQEKAQVLGWHVSS